ncbi:MAG: metallophosphoesterase [Candidatus Acidiferrales bacterium]
MMSPWLASLIFFSVLALLFSSQIFWFWRARRLLRARPERWQRWLLGVPLYAWFIGLLAMFLLLPVRWWLAGDAPVLVSLFAFFRRPVVMVPVGLWMTASLFSFVLIALVQGIGLLARIPKLFQRSSGAEAPALPERRYFLQTATYAAGALPFVMAGYGFFLGRQRYTVEEVDVHIANLPEGLDGLRLLQLTDVHASAYMPPREITRVVGLARELAPDLVFHTGDFITGPTDPLAPAVAELARVEGRYGGFGCLGNHEIYAGATEAATELFARRGVRILRRENVTLDINGARLNLIGVDYERQPRGRRPQDSTDRFLRGVELLMRPDAVNILLTHNPNPFLRAAELGIELTLAGHTHGGQVQVEILDHRWSPARFITPFIRGLYSLPAAGAAGLNYESRPLSAKHDARGTKHALLYVSPGIGTVGAPIRLNAPPEITLLTLRRA